MGKHGLLPCLPAGRDYDMIILIRVYVIFLVICVIRERKTLFGEVS